MIEENHKTNFFKKNNFKPWNQEIKKRMLTRINFLNLWPESLNQKYYTWKNNEAQFPVNQMLKDKIKKKILEKIY